MNSNTMGHLSHLAGSDYHSNRGWVCTLLSIPGATITGLRMGGVTIPLERLHVSAPYIRFIAQPEHGIQDADVVVSIPSTGTGGLPIPVTVALITLFGVIFGAILNYARAPIPTMAQEQFKVERRSEKPYKDSWLRDPTKVPAASSSADTTK